MSRDFRAVVTAASLLVTGRGLQMKHQVGVLLQLAVLSVLPLLIAWQLMFHIPLIVMPISLLIGSVIFLIGTRLRES